ncbi:MAG: DUF4350 domain-containing protein [Clostridia bacterium]|nr:DUF4350 domain-containing protein [Clostridia bacterium]
MKKMFRTVVLLVLCLSLVMSAFVGCKTPEEDDPPAKEMLTIIDGATDYKVIRSDLSTKDVTMAAVDLRKALIAATGVEIAIESDYVERGKEIPADTLEILVGATNRAESEQVLATLGENEYSISVVGNRVVIVGSTDEATIAAVDAFISQILGYNKETETYAVNKLQMEKDYSKKATFVPAPVEDDPYTPPVFTPVEGEQNKPTFSPAKYIVPTYSIENGLYVQNYKAFDLQGVRTTFQTGASYADSRAINSDSIMVYSTSAGTFKSWYDSEDFVIDMMIAINRANQNYLNLDPDNKNDIQTDSAGNYLEHSTGGSWYMVPSENWIEYVWSTMLLPMIEQYHPQTIALEEPEMWIRSGYSQTFKDEWEAFYGEEWEAPNSSAAANLKANLLKTYLFERILEELCARIEEVSPNTQVYIATHSTVNYAAWSITAGLNTYLALDCLDGVIGQTWADTHNSKFPYNGSSINDNFTNAFIEYSSYVDSVEGTNFYALADPMMDNTSRTEEGCQYMYRQSIAAQLMQPEIHRFEILPWVDRAFENVSGAYRTVQSSIFAMLNDLGGEEVTLRAGTPGIAYLASDSLSWMNTGAGWAYNPTDGMYGLCAPLVRDGIPVKMKAMEQIYTAEDLSGVTLLLASFDTSVPLTEEVNVAIADWVKAGGTLLYVSGYNQYWDIDDYFFWADDITPLYNLLRHLGLENIKVKTTDNGVQSNSRLSAVDDYLEIFNGHTLTSYAAGAITFEGAETPLLKAGDKTIAFEESVGKGQIVVCGIPTAAFAVYKGGAPMLRTLVEYALDYTDMNYVSSDMMVVKRGKYVIAHAFDTAEELEGTYINLFDPYLCVMEDPTVPKEDSLVLVDITDIDLSVPRLGFTSGELKGEVEETANTTTYVVTGAGNSIVANRLLAPKGKYPQKVTITNEDGKEQVMLSFVWDDDSNSVRFTFDAAVKPLTVTVTWGTEKTLLSSAGYVYEEVMILANNQNLDADYLITNTAQANNGLRYCDLAGQLVYKFDTTEYDSPVYHFSTSQNYIFEVSGDGKNWTMIADYSKGGTVPHIRDASNATTIVIDPIDYEDVDDSGTLYVRVRNSNTSMGWGGTVSRIVIRHKVEAEATTGETGEWLVGINPTSAIDDKGISTPAAQADEKKYLVKSANGINTYHRKVMTNASNLDLDFIVLNTAASNPSIRFCDNVGQVVYKFDLSDMKSFDLSLRIYQNYLLEVSTDNKNWEVVADYSQGGTIPHLTTGGNDVTIEIDVFEYADKGTPYFYVRLSNTNTAMGWGGSIRYFEMDYTKPAK